MTGQRSTTPSADRQRDLADLAARGGLADAYQEADDERRRTLWAGAYEIAGPLVFQQITAQLERQRGHHDCARSIATLQPDCLDRYHDDVEAVINDLFRNARVPIRNLAGWLVSRLHAATVDGYRRRRGERGALQRPRLPQWLLRELGKDQWLETLAIEILSWVGIPTSGGTGIWPIDAWAERRMIETGEYHDARTTRADVERVLAAMRRRPDWYANYVEHPLGRKQVVLAPAPVEVADSPTPLLLTNPDDADDAELRALAAVALEGISRAIEKGENPTTVVTKVLNIVFGSGIAGQDLDRLPGSTGDIDELLADPAVVDRVVATVASLSDQPDPVRAGTVTMFRDDDTPAKTPEPPTRVEALPALDRTVASRWRARLAESPAVTRNHWRTKTTYYRAVMDLMAHTPADRLTWSSIVKAAGPRGSRSTFYEVAGAHSRHPLVKAFLDEGRLDSIQLTHYYRRASAVDQLIDETKVWSYWPFRERMLAACALTPTALEDELNNALNQWASANPRLAAALDYAPPACAVEDLILVRSGLTVAAATSQLTEQTRRCVEEAVDAT